MSDRGIEVLLQKLFACANQGTIITLPVMNVKPGSCPGVDITSGELPEQH
jgi:hypothetical protein